MEFKANFIGVDLLLNQQNFTYVAIKMQLGVL